MTIGMLLNAPYPSDLRIKKETDALIKAGFRVFLLCLRRSNEKYEEIIQGLTIQRIDAGKNDVHLAFWDAIMSVSFIHPVFKNAIPGWVKRNDIKIIHVHDLPLTGTALSLRTRLNIPVVADFHENYPDALRTWFAWRKNPIVKLKNKIFMNPDRWATLEKKATQEADHVIAVVQEMKQRLIRDYDVPDNKITIVSNTEETSFLNQPEDRAVYKAYTGKFIVTYSGNIGPHRGVDTVIEAMQYLKNYPQIVFVIIGSGSNAVMSLLKNSVENLGLSNQVFFLGRQPFEKFYSFMLFADVNVIPHKSNGHTDNTIPHKLFQAMMVGKPVLVSSSTPLKRVIETTNAGVVFKAGDPKDLSEKILSLYENKFLQKELGENGKRATVQGTLNWEHEQRSLIDLYKKMLS